jgi:excisionase family DNA binding protein
MSTAILDSPERVFSLRQLEAAGYPGRDTLHKLIAAKELPAVKVGNAWKVRERDLVFLAEPIGAVPTDVDDVRYLEALAARIVSTWPRLSAERKLELGRLLAVA